MQHKTRQRATIHFSKGGGEELSSSNSKHFKLLTNYRNWFLAFSLVICSFVDKYLREWLFDIF